MSSRRFPWLLLLLFALLAMIGLLGWRIYSTPHAASSAPAPADPGGSSGTARLFVSEGNPQPNQPAPDFALPGVDGGTVKLADYAGQIVILNFWATWCPPCRAEMPVFQQVDAQRDDVTFIGVSVGEDAATVKAFLQNDVPVTYPIAVDPDLSTAMASRWDALSLPTTYLIDRRGRVQQAFVGGLSRDRLLEILNSVE